MKIPRKVIVWDRSIEKWLNLVVILLLVLFLRLPSFFEPVWYLDETIYLTIGNALNDGQVLYRDIVDHKTPLIYYLARVGGQTQFRLLLTFWMLATTAGVFVLLRKIGLNKKIVWLATLGFGVTISLPKFEGLLPNGELFVMGFVVSGLVLLSNSKLWRLAFSHKQRTVNKVTQLNFNNNQTRISSHGTPIPVSSGQSIGINDSIPISHFKLFIGGALLGLAILTKVPAIFDVIGVATIVYVGFWHQRSQQSFFYDLIKYSRSIGQELLWVTLGLFTPILLSILYFVLRGAGNEYLQFGLLYNFRYAGTWVPTSQPILNTLLSLPAKMIFLVLATFLITRFHKYFLPIIFWSSIWVILALIAATLSNRPYPHYFIQILLPLTLLLAGFGQTISNWWHKKDELTASHQGLVATTVVTLTLLITFGTTWQVLQVWKYPTLTYYGKFVKLILKQNTVLEYWQSFSHLVQNNYQVEQWLTENNIDELYIWGTNPSLYALTQTYPADQFTVLFHVTDLKHQTQTALNVIQDRPELIVIMHDAEEPPPPQLNSFIQSNYRPWKKLEHMTLWRLRQAV